MVDDLLDYSAKRLFCLISKPKTKKLKPEDDELLVVDVAATRALQLQPPSCISIIYIWRDSNASERPLSGVSNSTLWPSSCILVIMNGTWHDACASAFNSPSFQERVYGSGGVTVSAARFTIFGCHVDVSVRRLQLMLFVVS